MRKKIINNFKAAHAMSRNFGGQCGTECLTGSRHWEPNEEPSVYS